MRFLAHALVLALCLAASPAIRAETLDFDIDQVDDLHALLAPEEVFRPRLSPSGRHVVLFQRRDRSEGGDLLMVRDLDPRDGEPPITAADFGSLRVLWAEWANDDRLLVGVSMQGTVSFGRRFSLNIPMTRILSLSRQTLRDPVLLMENEGRLVFRNIYNMRLSDVANLLPDDPAHIMMPARRGQQLHLWRVNVNTGDAQVVERGTVSTIRWFTDAAGRAVMRVDISATGSRVHVHTRDPRSGRWRRSASYRINELAEAAPEFEWAGASDQTDRIYVFARPEGADRNGVYLYDLPSGTYVRQVAAHDRLDIGGPLIHPRRGDYMGYFYIDDRIHLAFDDPALAAHFGALEAFFEGQASILPVDIAGNRMVLLASGPQEPGVFYVYDRTQASVEPLFASRPRINPARLSPVLPVRYAARDGLEISAYVTIPPAGLTPSTPLVVMPHGGPESRSMYDFDVFAQIFAAHGYAVFEPNFRGSSGYGRAFTEAGYRQWGAAMQDDVTDGVIWLAAQGHVDPGRVCIAGFSYGGYAALMGAAVTPDLYRCAVAAAPAVDLADYVNYWRSRDEEAFTYWRDSMGDPRTDRERLHQASPVNLADRITIPVLLLHGDRDRIVPVSHGRAMADALRTAGVTHEYREYLLGDHSFTNRADRFDMVQRMLALFDRTIGPRTGIEAPFEGPSPLSWPAGEEADEAIEAEDADWGDYDATFDGEAVED